MLAAQARKLRQELAREMPDPRLRVLLCTDLEGFTSTVERLGDACARTLMREHNRLLRSSLHRHGGEEAMHTGDGILAAFRSPSAALEGATEIQRVFRAHSQRNPDAALRVRVGVHVGAPLPEDGRLFGCCVNVTVRVCGAAAAEHILLTDDVRRMAAESTRGQSALCDRGLFALKGLAQPLRLYELVWR